MVFLKYSGDVNLFNFLIRRVTRVKLENTPIINKNYQQEITHLVPKFPMASRQEVTGIGTAILYIVVEKIIDLQDNENSFNRSQ